MPYINSTEFQPNIGLADSIGNPAIDVRMFEHDETTYVPVIEGIHPSIIVTDNIRTRRKTLTALEPYGIPVSDDMTVSLDLYDTLQTGAYLGTPVVPNIFSLTAQTVSDAVRDYIDMKVRQDYGNELIRGLMIDAGRRVASAFAANTDALLGSKKIRSEFDALTAEFADIYPDVKGFRSITDAAEADESGGALGKWHRAKAIVRDLDKLSDQIITYVSPMPRGLKESPSGALGQGRVMTLAVDPDMGYQGALIGVGFEGMRLPNRNDYQWSKYGPALDSGSVLSLPEDADDWADRAQKMAA